MSLKPISPQTASELLAQGAVLIDIRDSDEYAREHIRGARHVPMNHLVTVGLTDLRGASAVIFHCRSGNRTRINAMALAARAPCTAYALDGGLDAWKKAGLPVETDTSRPLELQRQVQTVAGTLALAGTILGVTVSPWFHLVPGFVGAGLLFAGISGFCGLARVLMKMPWNQKAMQS